jgi:hypothetical protein
MDRVEQSISPCRYHLPLLPLRLLLPDDDHCVSHLPPRIRSERRLASPLIDLEGISTHCYQDGLHNKGKISLRFDVMEGLILSNSNIADITPSSYNYARFSPVVLIKLLSRH